MSGAFLMACKARVIFVAARKLDGKNVEDGVKVSAPSKSVNGLAIHQHFSYRDEPVSMVWNGIISIH